MVGYMIAADVHQALALTDATADQLEAWRAAHRARMARVSGSGDEDASCGGGSSGGGFGGGGFGGAAAGAPLAQRRARPAVVTRPGRPAALSIEVDAVELGPGGGWAFASPPPLHAGGGARAGGGGGGGGARPPAAGARATGSFSGRSGTAGGAGPPRRAPPLPPGLGGAMSYALPGHLLRSASRQGRSMAEAFIEQRYHCRGPDEALVRASRGGGGSRRIPPQLVHPSLLCIPPHPCIPPCIAYTSICSPHVCFLPLPSNKRRPQKTNARPRQGAAGIVIDGPVPFGGHIIIFGPVLSVPMLLSIVAPLRRCARAGGSRLGCPQRQCFASPSSTPECARRAAAPLNMPP